MAQTVKVFDAETLQPLHSCVISGIKPQFQIVTDSKGLATLSGLQPADSLYFRYVGYLEMAMSWQQLMDRKFEVGMTRADHGLDQVVITGSRTRERKLEVPNRITSIGLSEVIFQNPQTAADLLGISGFAYIQKSQLGGGSPMIRGMAANRVLLVVDGVRMNNAIFRSGNLQNVISLDANAIDNTEILFGPGSVMYGSDAIGGVMNFNTLQPDFSDSGSSILSGNILMRTSTANSEFTGHVDVFTGFRKWAFVSSFSRSEFGDLRSGARGGDPYFYRSRYVQTVDTSDFMVRNTDSSLQVGSGYEQVNLMQKIAFRPNKYWEFDYGFHFSETSPFNRYDRLYVVKTSGPNKGKLRWAEWYYGPQKWDMHRLGATFSKSNSFFDHLKLILALQHFEESRHDREFMSRELRMQKENVRALSLNLDLDKRHGNRWFWNYGLEVVGNRVSSEASQTHIVTKEVLPAVTRYPDGSVWRSYGAYAALKYKWRKGVTLSSGLRYSLYQILAEFDTTYFPFPFTEARMRQGTLNGSLGLTWMPRNNTQFYLNSASGFRAPNIDDMGKVFESTPGFLVVPNPDLKPERAYNLEMGTYMFLAGILKLDMAVYYTWLNNAMERQDFLLNGQPTIWYAGSQSKVQAIQNIAQARVYGLQAGFELRHGAMGLKSTFSYQKGREQTGDSLVYYPLRHAAPLFGSVHVLYNRNVFRLDCYALYNGRMDFDDLSLTERQNPSYARDYSKDPSGVPYCDGWVTFNAKAAFYFNPKLIVTAGVENIMNRLYRPYSSGINAPGRNLSIAVKVRI